MVGGGSFDPIHCDGRSAVAQILSWNLRLVGGVCISNMRARFYRHRLTAILALVAAGFLAIQGQSHPSLAQSRQDFLRRFSAAAIERTHHVVRYDSAYVRIPYPGGDVPAGTGVCTDEVIRAYRAVGIDLQKEVHEDMAANLGAYPRKWYGMRQSPDS